MDPEEDGATPPCRSRRVQQLQPLLPMPNSNDDQSNRTNQIQVEDASLSQYDTARTPSENSSNQQAAISYVNMQQSSQSQHSSSDPPEDSQPLFTGWTSSTPYLSSTLPQNISMNNTKTNYSTTMNPTNNQTSSDSSITSNMAFFTSDEFRSLQNTVQQMQSDMTNVQHSMSAINSRTNNIQQAITSVNNNMQENITNAVVNALN